MEFATTEEMLGNSLGFRQQLSRLIGFLNKDLLNTEVENIKSILQLADNIAPTLFEIRNEETGKLELLLNKENYPQDIPDETVDKAIRHVQSWMQSQSKGGELTNAGYSHLPTLCETGGLSYHLYGSADESVVILNEDLAIVPSQENFQLIQRCNISLLESGISEKLLKIMAPDGNCPISLEQSNEILAHIAGLRSNWNLECFKGIDRDVALSFLKNFELAISVLMDSIMLKFPAEVTNLKEDLIINLLFKLQSRSTIFRMSKYGDLT